MLVHCVTQCRWCGNARGCNEDIADTRVSNLRSVFNLSLIRHQKKTPQLPGSVVRMDSMCHSIRNSSHQSPSSTTSSYWRYQLTNLGVRWVLEQCSVESLISSCSIRCFRIEQSHFAVTFVNKISHRPLSLSCSFPVQTPQNSSEPWKPDVLQAPLEGIPFWEQFLLMVFKHTG